MNTDKNNTQLPQSSVSVSVTELRLGNLIDCFGECEGIGITERKIKVRRKSESGTRFLIEKIPKSSLSLKPILLSEDRFLKLGFDKHSVNPFWYRKKNLCISILGKVELISWDMQIFKIDTNIEFLHTLQNFYFLLNREELQDVILTEH